MSFEFHVCTSCCSFFSPHFLFCVWTLALWCFSCVLSIWYREVTMTNKPCVCVDAGQFVTLPHPPHCCYMWFLDAGPQGLTQTHSGSRQMLPAMPSVASWRFPSQSHRPVSAPLLCPPPLWCCGQRRMPAASDSRQLQGCLPHPPTHQEAIGKLDRPLPLVLKEHPDTSSLFSSGSWLLNRVSLFPTELCSTSSKFQSEPSVHFDWMDKRKKKYQQKG